MDIAETHAFLTQHGFIDKSALDPYFAFLQSPEIKNYHLAYRHEHARTAAKALLRTHADWTQASRLVHRMLHGTNPV